jgi:hypothetical protein
MEAQAAGHLGPPAPAPRTPGTRLRGHPRRPTSDRVPAELRTRTHPVEYLWGYWKHHALPNFGPDDLTELGFFGRLALRRTRRRPTLVRSF